jgi:hypothetical protein
MRYPMVTAALLLLMGTAAQAGGSCEKAKADYARQVAEDAAVSSEWGPGVKEHNDKFNERMKANILKGCAPGGFYDQLDEATRQVRAKCAAQPNTKGC